MKEKINICFEDKDYFSLVVLIIIKIRLEKNRKQIKIARLLIWVSVFVLFLLLIILDHNKTNYHFFFLPLIIFSVISGSIYAFSFLFSIVPIKRVRRDWTKDFELLISKSRCFFVNISIEDYKEGLIKEIEQGQKTIDRLIVQAYSEMIQLESSLIFFDGYNCSNTFIFLTREIVRGEISALKASIPEYESKKSELDKILTQISQ